MTELSPSRTISWLETRTAGGAEYIGPGEKQPNFCLLGRGAHEDAAHCLWGEA